jgi:hypothetical protein
MAQTCFHPSIEGAQHGVKRWLSSSIMRRIRCIRRTAIQLHAPGWKRFKSAQDIKDTLLNTK